ncbi:peroxisomal membrane protein Pex17 [Metarhizium album ARSEF 1941]|uniref:Peroxisomal membrane protein Pex17 n=1 Tax=Metarhizium album (strain ARSEF 1941) TaxID=1081103 RepID=A0A0B2X1C8_METAS|nr:peroxisomal membrane protein Pex17 [Metarhizium album ARSEF 1941]KHN99674.1 peroxisomal membrane protein Pex17 [Metarhizium album ARSEF 1941]
MPADSLLNTVLHYYQDVHDAVKTDQIMGSTAHLLSQLSNPLNLGVLTSQLLTAPAIWQRNDGAKTAMRVIGIYHNAAVRVRDNQLRGAKPGDPSERGGLRCDEWTRAVVKGADEGSRRWQHLLVLTGVLVGMEGHGRNSLSRSLRNALEQAVVTAANLALEGNVQDGPAAAVSVVTALNLALPVLSESHRAQIDCNTLLPIAVWAITGEEGFCDAQFLRVVNQDTTRQPGNVLSWPERSSSCQLLQQMEKQPLMANMGPLSKLAAFAVQHATDTTVVMQAHDALLVFTARVLDAWQKNCFSEIDSASESSRLTSETAQTTWPLLWQVLRKLMFGTTAVLQAIVARSLLDPHMLVPGLAPNIASKSLQILRNIFFISNRNGNSSFQVYTFSYMTSIDVLSRDGLATEAFLREIRPADAVLNPSAHLHTNLDLFYLNVAEHMPLSLPTEACELLIVKPAISYVSQEGPLAASMTEIFESAHSAILSVLSCPQHSALTIKITPFYIVKVFDSFPQHISPRQFRIAFKTAMEIVSPPFPIAAMEPHMSETLLDMLRTKTTTAGTTLLPATPDTVSRALEETKDEPLSEQSALVMTLVDSLPFLPLPLVEEWLAITAQAMNEIEDPRLRLPVKKRFWNILVNGEMDVERSTIGVAWWGTKGGRELVLFGGAPEPPLMSGALGKDTTSRL